MFVKNDHGKGVKTLGNPENAPGLKFLASMSDASESNILSESIQSMSLK